MSEISVLGIFVADISFSGSKIPAIGETILGSKYNIGPGGKGCNQAIAVARLGGKVSFISKIGKDNYGELALDTLKKNNISTTNIIQDENSQTGVAGILVDQNSGKNAINVITGAPSSLTTKELDKHIDTIKKSKIFLTQLEVPKEVTLYCLKTAKENNCLTILNPAPASEIKGFFDYIDFFTPNETEAEFYTGIKITNEKEAKIAAEKILEMGIKKVVITLGEKGLFYSDGKEEIYLKADENIKAIDTTGAGDAFNGGLAFALSQKKPIEECLKIANRVGGLSTLKLGAGNAMPYEKDL